MRYWNDFAFWLRRNFGITPEQLIAGLIAIAMTGYIAFISLAWVWNNRHETLVAIFYAIKLIGGFVKSAASEAGVNLPFNDFYVGLGFIAFIKWFFSSRNVFNRNVNNNYNK